MSIPDDEDFGPESYFTSWDCTCEHEPEQHTWGECAQDGCACKAGWEE